MVQQIDKYPYSLGGIGEAIKYLILEDDFFLYYGKRRKEDGTFELYSKVTSRYYPHDIIPNGEKVGISVYKAGGLPSASWTLDSKNKSIYLFLSLTTSYVSDQPTLPEDILAQFDSSEPDLTAGLIENKDNIYDVLAESGAFFTPFRSYRQYALVRSAYNGALYQKKSEGLSLPGESQKDPYQDPVNWEEVGGRGGDEGGNSALYVDIQSNQNVAGTKTFDYIYKSSVSANPTALEVLSYKEAENAFLKLGDTAENARRVMGYTPSEIGGYNAGRQVLVLTNNQGKIDDTFLNATIASTDRNLKVDPSKADNITTFNTIQEAWEVACKMIILGNVTIEVADGIYTKNSIYPVMNLTGKYDAGKISIIGNINHPENCIVRFGNTQQGLYFNGKGIFVNGFTFQQQETERGTSIGINIDSSGSIILGKSVVVDNCSIGLLASELSYVDADYIQATNCETAYYADSSTININYSKAQSCEIGCIADNRSVVYARGSVYNKGSIQTNNTIGFRAIYGSVIRAPETLGNTDLDNQYDNNNTNVPNSTLGIIEYT